MQPSPFIDDPRNAFRRQIAAAVESPMEEARAMHLGLAEHLAGIARGSGLDLVDIRDSAAGAEGDKSDARWRVTLRRMIQRVADWSRRGSIDGGV